MANSGSGNISVPLTAADDLMDMMGKLPLPIHEQFIAPTLRGPVMAPARLSGSAPALAPLWPGSGAAPAPTITGSAPAPARLGPSIFPMIGPLPNAVVSSIAAPVNEPPAPRSTGQRLKGILGTIGEVAGSALIPHVMPFIPGTTQNRELKEAEQAAQGERAEKAALSGAESTKDIAQAEQAQAEAEKARRPVPLTEPGLHAQQEQQWLAVNPGKTLADYDAMRQGKLTAAEEAAKPVPKVPLIEQVMSAEQVLRDPASTPEQKQTAQQTIDAGQAAVQSMKPPATGVNAEIFSAIQTLRDPTTTDEQKAAAQHTLQSGEQYEKLTGGTGFPRVFPVTDAQGNILGYTDFQGTKGGGVTSQYIPLSSVPGVPEPVIPPKPTAAVLSQSQRAEMIQPQIESLKSQVEKVKDSLGPLSGRWSDVMVGKVGTDNPEVAKLQMQLKLYTTALMLAHGLRGEQYEQSLGRYLGLAQSADDLLARIDGANGYLQDYAASTGHGAEPEGNTPLPRPKAGDVVMGHKFLGGDPNDQKNWQAIQGK